MDYKNGKIYRIVCNASGKQYIGSTTQPLSKRFSYHRKNYKCYLNDSYCYVSSFEILKNNDCEIVLIEDFPCETKDQLHKRERYWIERLVCVNRNIPTRTFKEYYTDNRNTFLERSKVRRETHKESIANYQKEYRQQNKEHIQEQTKKWKQNNKDKIHTRVVCECGTEIDKNNISAHRKTQKHRQLLSMKGDV